MPSTPLALLPCTLPFSCRLLETSPFSPDSGTTMDLLQVAFKDRVPWTPHKVPASPIARRGYAVGVAIIKSGLLGSGLDPGREDDEAGIPAKASKRVGGSEFKHDANIPRGPQYKLPTWVTEAYMDVDADSQPPEVSSTMSSWKDLLGRGLHVSIPCSDMRTNCITLRPPEPSILRLWAFMTLWLRRESGNPRAFRLGRDCSHHCTTPRARARNWRDLRVVLVSTAE